MRRMHEAIAMEDTRGHLARFEHSLTSESLSRTLGKTLGKVFLGVTP